MARYVFTVPALFDVEPHPLGIGPDDLFLLDVECFDVGAGETLARIKANELFGPLAWCSVYPADHPALPGLIARYYPGRIVDIDGQEVELFDTPTPTTPDLLTALEASVKAAKAVRKARETLIAAAFDVDLAAGEVD